MNLTSSVPAEGGGLERVSAAGAGGADAAATGAGAAATGADAAGVAAGAVEALDGG